MVDGTYKLIEMTRPMEKRQLFDRSSDPHEQTDLWSQRPVTGAYLVDLARRQRNSLTSPALESDVEIDDNTRRRLEALGYLQ